MPEKEKLPPIRNNGPSSRWITKLLRGSYDHYTWMLPDKMDRFSNLLLKLFYKGIKIESQQTEILQGLDEDAIVVYVNKFKSFFEYLFYYNRYQQEKLPYPQMGFDYKVYVWQPFSKLLRIPLAKLVSLVRHGSAPNPFRSGFVKQELLDGRCAFLSLVGKKIFHRRFIKAETDPIQHLIEMQNSIDRPIYIIPQLMFFSKTARRENPTLIDILFGPEDKPGNIRKLVNLFKNSSRVFVEVSEPLNLKHYLASAEACDKSTEYQSLLLRRDLLIQLTSHRQSITGPVRKSREELKESILTTERFQRFMETYAENRDIPIQQVRRKAAGYIEEIAANYSPAFIKVASVMVGWIVRVMFDGFTTNHDVLNRVRNMSQKGPLLLIPSHKSHIDYLILDYVLYHNNLSVPHIAAGKNLSFWPMGPIFRSGGAFFLRRSFGGAVLYSKVFAEYIHKLLEEGYNVEQFIEGGRSRTGKLLMPKLGLLSILMNAFKNGACKDMLIVPIYVGYDRIIEEKSYLHELGGGKKEPENIFQVFRARKFLKKRYGKIYIQFHEPISVNQLQSQQGQSLADMKSKERNAFIRNLGYQIINAINRVTVVTPHGLVAGAVLNFTKEKFSIGELFSVLETYMRFLTTQNAKLSDTLVSHQQAAFEKVVASYTQRKFIESLSKNNEDTDAEREFLINESRRPYLEYYKNTCIAFFIPPAYTAMAILEKDSFRFSASDLHAGYGFWRKFFKFEFAYDVDIRSEFHVRKCIKAFIDEGMVIPHQTLPDTYDVTPEGFRKLRIFADFLKTYFESYWIVLNFYMRNPQNKVKAKDRLKKLTARGNRMYKRKEIDRKEALSKVTYQNAVEMFSRRGIKGSDDTEKIEIYSVALQKALKYLRP
ncbi:MAG: 1-acyl-sn-glycerol-3-phosphate acyltransferase [Deltaproteobacteria bacterium]|nr:1-acyl-sn-glycerol-3-phosphate acyltransferase [Deltaproteobacteria bacterium]